MTRLIEPWTYTHPETITTTEDPRQSLVPTTDEKTGFDQLAAKIAQVAASDTVVIGLINDTHLDSYNTAQSANTLHDLKALSYFAKNYGLDALVANGDLNDGVQTLDRTILDIDRAVTALKTSDTPFFITQATTMTTPDLPDTKTATALTRCSQTLQHPIYEIVMLLPAKFGHKQASLPSTANTGYLTAQSV
ncbi:hypothetical protein [Secundilactobacillus paracollinoides]|uniref:hypothetical protein n=1 Tax=Secundilactobacillus paracollinoides TaxID=240427 RepID=UPI0006D16B0F|nr:hypothetical protein [Secundilactobacillus paracollinoides]